MRGMRFVVFGLSVSSSWGNGHAALWRGLINGLIEDGHHVAFFERDTPYYAEHRDLDRLPAGAELALYADWDDVRVRARAALSGCDVGIVTSYCPDALAAAELMADCKTPLRCFYDLDTPVTLHNLAAGRPAAYLGPDGLAGYDLALSYTGGAALDGLRDRLGARRVAPLYGSVDPAIHRPVAAPAGRRRDLSYLGTYAADRQAALTALLIEPAGLRPKSRFVIAGAQYPVDFPWRANIDFMRHLPPAEHAAFYAAARLTLNVTRGPMAAMGWCPSGRLFEAAACGAPILSDGWAGLEAFFLPGEEILVAADAEGALAALDQSDAALARLARLARERVLAEHTAAIRARQLVAAVESAMAPA